MQMHIKPIYLICFSPCGKQASFITQFIILRLIGPLLRLDYLTGANNCVGEGRRLIKIKTYLSFCTAFRSFLHNNFLGPKRLFLSRETVLLRAGIAMSSITCGTRGPGSPW